ncbi:MAG TPA: hypothetical protein VF771_05130 [Longimicrobiaceae bacterium]
MRSLRLVLPLLVAAAGCKGADALTITGPSATKLTENGVEQVLELQANHPWQGQRGAFAITSRLVNTGTQPVTLRVKTCELKYGIDLQSTPAIGLVAVAEPECIPTPDVITLQPGQSSGTLWFGGIVEHPGTYSISIRHALEPESWATIQITAR